MIKMMPNNQIRLDSCQICNQLLKHIAVKCDLCEAGFHKRCANLTQQQLRLIHCKHINYMCISCCEEFPFQEINDDEFVYENCSVEDTYDHYKLMDKRSQFNLNSFNYSECSPHNFGNDIDPNKNFYNNTSKCKYYTDLQLNEEIGGVNGMSFIHFNARSLKTNFHKIKDYILELKVKFDIIAIAETWIEPSLINDFNIKNYDAFHITRGTRRGCGDTQTKNYQAH